MTKKKKGKNKIPKRIAGVKVPKKVRKKANRALELADNPIVREAAAAALAAGAARLIASMESIAKEHKAENRKETEDKEEEPGKNSPLSAD